MFHDNEYCFGKVETNKMSNIIKSAIKRKKYEKNSQFDLL